jgi:hypothetical protein
MKQNNWDPTTNFDGKLSFILSFIFLSTSTTATYIFTAPTTVLTLKPCALNAEFQHFILRFNKISLLCDTTQRGDRG